MARYVSVSAGVVTIAGIDWDGVTPYSSPDGGELIASDTANVGDAWNGTSFTTSTATTSVIVPATVTSAQLRLALDDAGLLAQVNAGVGAGDAEIQTYWGYANTFDRANPLVIQLANSLGFTSAQMDAVFIAAANFPDS